GGAISALRASSEITSPAVFFSRRARSLAACRTSSAISSVVRMHQMLMHQTSTVKIGASLFRWAPVVDALRLTQPALHLVRSANKTCNFSDFLVRTLAGARAATALLGT